VSDHTRAANCPNVARVGDTTLFADHSEVAYDPDAPDLNGWRLKVGDQSYNTMFPTDGNRLAPEAYIGPDGELVWVLNSSEYAPVGVNDWVVFGPDAAHVGEFLKACGFKGVRIVKSSIVMQTL
jgi:hypothetical protein